MSSIYDQVWTIRGLVDVTADIFMLPGDELRILGEGNGPYRIVVIRGDKIWEGCDDLTVIGEGIEPTTGIQEPANSVNLSDGGVYNAEVQVFVNNINTEWMGLQGTLPTTNGAGQPEEANVRLWAPKISNNKRILIIKVEHRDGAAQQNGTGHGDHR